MYFKLNFNKLNQKTLIFYVKTFSFYQIFMIILFLMHFIISDLECYSQ